MKLLIVDDQQATLQGLAENIDWAGEGFQSVETARNAMEARLSFRRQEPDVMLCDIEMPVETGMDLVRWVREQGYETRVIFLTCHTEFRYAQEAIALRANDYVVQPAPYHVIRQRVHKLVGDLRQVHQEQQLQELGTTYEPKQQEIGSSLWRSYLQKAVDSRSLKDLPCLPDPEKDGVLILMQVIRWHTKKLACGVRNEYTPDTMKALGMNDPKWTNPNAVWPDGLMTAALQNMTSEIFEHKASCVLASGMLPDLFSVVIQLKIGQTLSETELKSKLEYLLSAYTLYTPCTVAFYVSEPCPIRQMQETWERLQTQKDRIPAESGVFFEREFADPEPTALAEDAEADVVRSIKDYVRNNLWSDIRKEDIVELVHLNGDYVTRLFKKETGMSIKAYVIQQKLLEAQRLLRTTNLTVSSVAVQLGYNNFSHFSAQYKREFGITPAEEQRNARG